MEDKLLNKIIIQHMKHYVVSNNAIKHKTNLNDHKTNITTTSISRETSESQLKNNSLISPITSAITKIPIRKNIKTTSKSSERTATNNFKEKSREKILVIKKTTFVPSKKFIKSSSIQPKFKDSYAKQDSTKNEKSFVSKISSKNSSVLNKSQSTGLDKKDSTILAHKTNLSYKKLSLEISPEKSFYLLKDGTGDNLENFTQVKAPKNYPQMNNNYTNKSQNLLTNSCCTINKKDKLATKCKCKKQIEEKDKIISSLNSKIKDLQNRLRKMETLFKYSKSVDLRQSFITESNEFPKKVSMKKKRQISYLNIDEDKSIKETITPSHANYKYHSKIISSQFTTKQSFKDKDSKDLHNYTLRSNYSKDKKTKRFSHNLTGYNFSMIKPSIPGNRKRDKLSKSRDDAIKPLMKSSYNLKESKKTYPNFLTTPIDCEEIAQDKIINDNTVDENKYSIFNEVDENKYADRNEFSFHNENNSDDDIKNQLVLIKTRTQNLMKKLSDANKKLVRRVNSIPSFN